MSRINALRKRIPYGYWLAYDAVIGGLLVYGCSRELVFAFGLPFLAVAVFFDAVEWVAKRMTPGRAWG